MLTYGTEKGRSCIVPHNPCDSVGHPLLDHIAVVQSRDRWRNKPFRAELSSRKANLSKPDLIVELVHVWMSSYGGIRMLTWLNLISCLASESVALFRASWVKVCERCINLSRLAVT